MSTDKSDRIKATLAATRARRKTQECHVYELKIDRGKLSVDTQDRLTRLFLEAKWFTNSILASEDLFAFDTKTRWTLVKVGDQFEERRCYVLSSQMKQALHSRIQSAIYALATQKQQGRKVGKLKFKSFVASIPLKQYGLTYQIVDAHHIRIQNLKEPLRVFGIEQLNGAEIANANLIQKAGDYYLKVTAYRPKETVEKPCGSIGIDFNIERGCQIVLSNGIAIGFEVPSDSKKIKGLQSQMARMDRTNKRVHRRKHTKNRSKARARLHKEYERFNRKKREIAHQIVHVLKTLFSSLYFQNENLKGWQKLWGKRIQATALGEILAQLKTLAASYMLDRFVPTTKTCSCCGYIHRDITLKDKCWVCPVCAACHNRHVNAAVNMLPGPDRASTPAERMSSAPILLSVLCAIRKIGISVRLLDETGTSFVPA